MAELSLNGLKSVLQRIKGIYGSAGTNEDYRLIKDVTLTEDVTELLIDTDTDGNTFKCKELLVYIIFKPAQGRLDWSNLYVNGDKYNNARLSFNNLQADSTYNCYDLLIMAYKGFKAELWLRNNSHANPASLVGNPTVKPESFITNPGPSSWITKYEFICAAGKTLLAGTRMVIYGRVFDK